MAALRQRIDRLERSTGRQDQWLKELIERSEVIRRALQNGDAPPVFDDQGKFRSPGLAQTADELLSFIRG